MTITLRTAGTATGLNDAVTAVNPVVPATSAGDISVLTVSLKPYTATITDPAGWTKIGEFTSGTTAQAADAGSMKVLVYVRESATAGAIGAIAQSGGNSMQAVIHSYQKTGSGWDYSQFAVGADSTPGINYSATGGTTIAGIAVGDWLISCTSINHDIGITGGLALTFTGATLTAITNRSNVNCSTGNDCGIHIGEASVTAVSTGAGPPTHAHSSTAAAGQGATLFLRLSDTPAVVPYPYVLLTPTPRYLN